MSDTFEPVNHFNFNCPYEPQPLNNFNFPYTGCDNIIGEFDLYAGSGIEFEFSDTNYAYHGSNVNVTALEVDKLFVTLPAQHGSNVAGVLDVSVQYAIRYYCGSNAYGILTTRNPVVFELNARNGAQRGSNVNIHVNTEPRFAADAHHGSNVRNLDLLLPLVISADGYHGSQMQFAFFEPPAAPLGIAYAWHGIRPNLETIVLSSHGFRNANAYHGISASLDELAIPALVPLPVSNGYHGNHVSLNTINFATVNYQPFVVTGSNVATIPDDGFILDKSGFAIAAHGNHVSVNLKTEIIINEPFEHGSMVSFGVDIPPPRTLVAHAHKGSSINAELKHLFSPPLYPYIISHTSWVDVRTDGETSSFDLCKTCKSNRYYHTCFNFELANYCDPTTRCSADIPKVVSFELETAPRFIGARVYTGSNVEALPSEIKLFEATAYHGVQFNKPYPYNDLNPRLTYGGFIPDIHSADVELHGEVPDQDFYIKAYHGSNIKFVLEANYGRASNNYHGSNVEFILTTEQPWLAIVWHNKGWLVDLSTTPQLGNNGWHGAVIEAELYIPPYRIYTGSSIDVNMSTDYDIEFTEVGCLPNEFIYMNATGDADNSQFQSQAVEILPYRHEIKSRCF